MAVNILNIATSRQPVKMAAPTITWCRANMETPGWDAGYLSLDNACTKAPALLRETF